MTGWMSLMSSLMGCLVEASSVVFARGSVEFNFES